MLYKINSNWSFEFANIFCLQSSSSDVILDRVRQFMGKNNVWPKCILSSYQIFDIMADITIMIDRNMKPG